MSNSCPKSRELEEKAAICLAIVEFFQETHPSPLLTEMSNVVVTARDGKNVKGLKTLLRDLREWATALPIDEQGRLDTALKGKFGKTLEQLAGAEKLVQKVLKAGVIRTDDEYEFLERFVAESAESPDAERANQLLGAYKST